MHYIRVECFKEDGTLFTGYVFPVDGVDEAIEDWEAEVKKSARAMRDDARLNGVKLRHPPFTISHHEVDSPKEYYEARGPVVYSAPESTKTVNLQRLALGRDKGGVHE